MRDRLVIKIQEKQPTARDFWLAGNGTLDDLRGIEVLTEEIILSIIKRIPEFLMELMPEQMTPAIVEEAISQNPYLYKFVPSQFKTEALGDLAVEKSGFVVRFINNPTLKQQLMAVNQQGANLKYIQEQTEEICLSAVRKDAYAIDYVKEQTPRLCWEALKQSPMTIEYIKNQDEEMCKYAIKAIPSLVRNVQCYPVDETYHALKLAPEWFGEIKGNKEEVYRRLIEAYPDALEFLDNSYLTESVCVELVEKDASNLKFIPEEFKSLEVCMTAYEKGNKAEPYLSL